MRRDSIFYMDEKVLGRKSELIENLQKFIDEQ